MRQRRLENRAMLSTQSQVYHAHTKREIYVERENKSLDLREQQPPNTQHILSVVQQQPPNTQHILSVTIMRTQREIYKSLDLRKTKHLVTPKSLILPKLAPRVRVRRRRNTRDAVRAAPTRPCGHTTQREALTPTKARSVAHMDKNRSQLVCAAGVGGSMVARTGNALSKSNN